MRIGIVAEGPSDWIVLEEIIRAIHHVAEFERLRPEQPVGPTGWRGVKAWCEEYGEKLTTLMLGVENRPLDLIVIHVDTSMADKVGADRPCPPASATGTALRQTIQQSWLGLDTLPGNIILATPSKSSDAWTIAALDPPSENIRHIECDFEIERELVQRFRFRLRDGQVKKPQSKYKEIAKEIGLNLVRVRTACSEADRFCNDFTAFVIDEEGSGSADSE